MKKFIFLALLLGGQVGFGLGLTDLIMDYATGDAEKLCSKRAQLDRPACNEFIKGKRFRKEFLSVCFKMNDKFGAEQSMQCLKEIADKSPVAASRKQAEICEELVASKDFNRVLSCVKANVGETFATVCSRYVDGGKAYQSAAACVNALNGVTPEDLDMAHFRGACMNIKDKTDFSKNMAPCLVNAESKTGGASKIQERIDSSAQQ